MMRQELENVRKEVISGIELERILRLPVAEKFRLLEYIKLIAQEAAYAEEYTYFRLKESPNYEKDRTYKLLAPLLVHDVSFDDMRRIILNYLYKFQMSDTYYSKFAILGIGVLFIKRGIDSYTIFHTLLCMLGVHFLTENLRFAGYKLAFEKEIKIDSIIRYKEYENTYRNTKYHLLALGLLHREEGKAAMDEFMLHHCKEEKVQLLYHILSELPPGEYRLATFNSLLVGGDDYDNMILAGLYSVIRKSTLMVSHYMMNSMIGKYSHFDLRPERVEAEAREILASMKSKLGLQ